MASESTPHTHLPWSYIETHIQKLILDSSVHQILDEIERGITVPKLHAPYADLFGENELFEFNNPALHYRLVYPFTRRFPKNKSVNLSTVADSGAFYP